MHKNTLLALLLPAVSVLVACGGSPPPPAKNAETAPTNTSAKTEDPKAVEAAVQASPTASAVNIDPAITKACGLGAAETYFAFDSARPRPEDGKILEKVATCFASGPLKGRTLKLVGHSDPRGTDEYNMTLGLARADSVGNYVKTHGLPEKQVQTSSRGKLDASGTDEPSWAKDRRVDLALE
ncbi:MAG: OmpA family protein [Polyangiaceae bacterium]|nr:OmpA family protein [Polyangiaceae bacterium]